VLTAEEIAGLDLRGCELAVLSTCRSGEGKVVAGEGVLGLKRAFHLAGTRAVVTSLWEVNDPATSVLMEQFYRGLWSRKLSKMEALRQAQLYVLRHPEAVATRARELRALLQDHRGMSVAVRARAEVLALPAGSRPKVARSPFAWWASWVLSGHAGR
jgi:CHAT domain-containing protein